MKHVQKGGSTAFISYWGWGEGQLCCVNVMSLCVAVMFYSQIPPELMRTLYNCSFFSPQGFHAGKKMGNFERKGKKSFQAVGKSNSISTGLEGEKRVGVPCTNNAPFLPFLVLIIVFLLGKEVGRELRDRFICSSPDSSIITSCKNIPKRDTTTWSLGTPLCNASFCMSQERLNH